MARSSSSFNAFIGTIAAGGTLSEIIDTEGFPFHGLIVSALTSTLTVSTLNILVSNDTTVGFATLQQVTAGVLGNIAWGHQTGNFAVSGNDMQVIKPYRYVRFIESAAQVNGAKYMIPVKE